MLDAIYRAVRVNLGLKMLSVLMAAALWFYVMSHEDPVRTESYERPVEVINVPPGLVVLKVRPERIRVTVSARLSELHANGANAVRLVADLTGARIERNQVEVRPELSSDRISIRHMERTTAQVSLDRFASETCKVRALSAELGEANLRVDPAEVTISGPAQTIRRVTRVVARLGKGELASGRSVSLRPTPVDAGEQPVAGVSVAPDTVTVRLAPSPKAKIPTPPGVRPAVGAGAPTGEPPATPEKAKPTTSTPGPGDAGEGSPPAQTPPGAGAAEKAPEAPIGGAPASPPGAGKAAPASGPPSREHNPGQEPTPPRPGAPKQGR